jgi:hypothetical protein
LVDADTKDEKGGGERKSLLDMIDFKALLGKKDSAKDKAKA